ncbi:MAG: 3,4-dihydroxy-2-butanone-4-phosphate synthase, partial [Actinomycetota bacterium]
ADRFSVALIPITRRESTLGALVTGDRVNLESDLVLKAARDLHTCARLVPARSLAGLPWAGELRGAHERAATIRRLAHPGARPEDFLRPGHVFPLAGRRGGLAGRGAYRGLPRALRRRRPPPVAAICEVMGPDGYMLTGSAVQRFALRWGIPMIAVDDLASWL